MPRICMGFQKTLYKLTNEANNIKYLESKSSHMTSEALVHWEIGQTQQKVMCRL